MHKKKVNTKRGFSLYETLIAIFILTYAVASAMTLVQKSLSSSTYSRDQVVASFLAEDAVEYIRNVRDEAFVQTSINAAKNSDADPDNDVSPANVGWMTYISPADCTTGATCRVDTTLDPSSAFSHCSGSACVLNFNSGNSEYGYTTGGSWAASRFSRSFTITDVPGSAFEKYITVTVTWASGPFGTQTYTVVDHITNWDAVSS